jgi:hypothetical protein
MKHELSDMLLEAKSDPPPARYSVDDAVHAGRRLRRRHRATWAAAVVVGVAAVVTVPQVIAGPGPAIAPVAYPEAKFAANLTGFTSGAYTVSGTVHVTQGYQMAVISGPGKELDARHAAERDFQVPRQAGTVVVYRPGAFDPANIAQGEPVEIDGRPGYYRESLEWNRLRLADRPPLTWSPTASLAWEYADDAWAEAALWTTSGGTRETLTEIAAGVTFTEPRPVAVGIKLTKVPTGFKLVAAGSPDNAMMLPLGALSYLRLVEGKVSYLGLAGPAPDNGLPVIEIRVYPRGWNAMPPGRTGTEPFCAGENVCYRLTDDQKYEIQITSEPAPHADLRPMLQYVTVADLADRATWFDATKAAG